MAGGFGCPYFVFYAPLIYTVSALFNLVGIGLIASMKCMLILGVLLAGVGMYFFSRLFLGTYGGVVSAVAYVYLPYRIVNLYVRGDFAEAFAMALIPWVFYFLYTTLSRKHLMHMIGLALSYAGLIFTHNCTALTASGMIVFFLIFVAFSKKDFRGFLFGLLGLILGWSLSAVFWVPALLEKSLVNIELIYSNPAFDFHNNFIELFRLFWPTWSLDSGIGGRDLPLQIGAPHILLTILSGSALWNHRERILPGTRQTLLFFFLSLVVLIFLTQRSATFVWESIFLMQYIQFPWRLLALIGFCVSFLAGSLFCIFRSASRTERYVLQTVLVIVIVLSGVQYCYVRGYYRLDERAMTPAFVRDQWSTASSYNTADMTHVQDFGEYLPKTVRKLPAKNKAGRVMVTSGRAHVSSVKKRIDGLNFDVAVTEDAEITIGIFYYPTWKAQVGRQDYPLYTDDEGLIHLKLLKGNYHLVVFFDDSRARQISAYLSFFTLVSLLGIGAVFFKTHRGRKPGPGTGRSGISSKGNGLPEIE